MKALLSALAIVAYVATTGDAAGEQASHLAWFPSLIYSPYPVSASAINPYCTEMQFRREVHPHAIILKADGMLNPVCHCGQSNPVCLNSLGISLHGGRNIFCNLVSIGITQIGDENLRIVLLFESQTTKRLRLHIPVQLISDEEAYGRMNEYEDSEFVQGPAFLLSFSRLRDIRNYDPVRYNFFWLANLLRRGIKKLSSSDEYYRLLSEGPDDGAKEYETENVLLSKMAFLMISDVIQDKTRPLLDLLNS